MQEFPGELQMHIHPRGLVTYVTYVTCLTA
jgi:hypothetical protein